MVATALMMLSTLGLLMVVLMYIEFSVELLRRSMSSSRASGTTNAGCLSTISVNSQIK